MGPIDSFDRIIDYLGYITLFSTIQIEHLLIQLNC